MRWKPERAAGLVFVVLLHLAVVWAALQHKLIPVPEKLETLMVHFITPPKAPEPEPPKPRVEPPRPVKLEKPRPPDPLGR